jgi:transcription-repair coupling factor (superfamily II helicase)
MLPTLPLTLRALFGGAISTLRLDQVVPITAGLTPAAKAIALAAVSRTSGEELTLAVVPSDRDVEQLTADARFFYEALEGAPGADVKAAVLPLPSLQVDPYRGMTPHFRVAAARARALHGVATGTARLIVASAAGLLPRVSPPDRLLRASRVLKIGSEFDPQDFAHLLVDAGFTHEELVDEHGAFAMRGGIIDVFPADDVEPVRIEFVGDRVETLRNFDPATQRSTGVVNQVLILPVRETFDDWTDRGSTEELRIPVLDFMSVGHGIQLLVSEHEEVEKQARKVQSQLDRSYADAATRGQVVARPPAEALVGWEYWAPRLTTAARLEELAIQEPAQAVLPSSHSLQPSRHISCQPSLEFRGRVGDWVADVRQARERGDTVLFVAGTPGLAERAVEILKEYNVLAAPVERVGRSDVGAVLVAVGALSGGFRLAEAALQVYAETDVFEEERRGPDQPQNLTKTFLSDLRDLKVNDLVVHVNHGIGEFVGLKQLAVGGGTSEAQEFLELRYAVNDKLFVPVQQLDLVQKYSGGSRPKLDRLGGTSWEKAKTRVKKAMRDMAEELLKLYAQRRAISGHAFAPDTHWQEEFESAFPYELTPDQETAVADIKRDMEAPTPMDRLLCGDVGYGKTEVAVRAAFKAIMDGKQVAVLAPTTVLAFQHVKTLTERFSSFPVTVDMISRFRTPSEIKQALEALGAGKVDVIVGTHRLLSKDVQFKELGLLVVDEEQRFGVAHKERIKQMRKRVDVLTMTATPIPRTLNMSLAGIRDMSIIETPPKDRLSIQTNVVKFDASVIERAVRNEIARDGQVYVVHNRVESIYSIADLLHRLVPEARIVVGHGQMSEDQLERAMMGFVEHRFDVLVATTIVENGLDIPNANTIIINRADRYGLAQLYQLRGRVGRSDRPAYSYLLIPPVDSLSPVARRRLAAIREFSDLGSGFRVAALDLEIRGAGNLLGGEQSGQIDAVGFEMYTKLLEQTIRELKGEVVDDITRSAVNLDVDLRINPAYIPDTNQRITVYRNVAAARTEVELETTLEILRDRYGPLPTSVLNLAEYGRIRILAGELGVETIDREQRTVVIRFRPTAPVDPQRLVKLVHEWPGAMLLPPVSLRLDLDATGKTSGQLGRQGGSSWWTARATAGAVTAGFTKDKILRRPELDPRKDGGLFSHLEGLLRALRE